MNPVKQPIIGVISALLLGLTGVGGAVDASRRVLSLNGSWDIGEGKMNAPPAAFDHTVPVPGLVDMATPTFDFAWEPEFYQYVRDAFAPVGLMIDAWAENYPAGARQEFPVMLVNDLREPWKGEARFRILKNGVTISEQKLPAETAGFGTSKLTFTISIPQAAGDYQAEAVLMETPVGQVRSLRDFIVNP